MTDIYLIRHSVTAGNKLGRYIGGETDEPLCEEGIELLRSVRYPTPKMLMVSPMLRCRQTAELLFPGIRMEEDELLRECDFGLFENKNYKELSGDESYQKWIDSNGTMPFPGGESQKSFQDRCLRGFYRCMERCLEEEMESVAFVIHGGTIMSIMSACAVPRKDYFSWQVKNGEGYLLQTDHKMWEQKRQMTKIKKYTQEGFRCD